MKTKKSGVRGSVITSADLKKATAYIGMAFDKLERYPGSLDEALPIGNGSPFDGALIPFDIVANGGKLNADKKSIDGFFEAWLFGIPSRCDGEGLLVESVRRVLNMFSRAGGCDFNKGVFIADYGYFRGEFTKWMIRFCRGFVARDFEEIETSIEAIKNETRKLNVKSGVAYAYSKGEKKDEDYKEVQVDKACERYNDPSKKKLRGRLTQIIDDVLEMDEINGIKIPDGMGYVKGNKNRHCSKVSGNEVLI